MRSLIFFLLLSCPLFAQTPLRKTLKLSAIVGFRLHTNEYELGSVGKPKILTSPTLGLALSRSGSPLSATYQLDGNLKMQTPIHDSLRLNASSVTETWIEHQIQLYWQLKQFSVGLGGYWKRRENIGTHLAPGSFISKYWGLQLAISIPTSWIDLEFRTKINLDPFAAFGTSQHSLMVLYRTSRPNEHKKEPRNIEVSALLGARFFSTASLKKVAGEDFNRIGIAPDIGIEFLHQRLQTAVFLERDWWVALNGGSFTRDVKGYINTATMGIGYRHLLQNTRSLSLKVGASFIIDSDKLIQLKDNTPNLSRVFNFQVKGISVGCSYELFARTDLEVRHIFPWVGDQLFSSRRLSLGLIHRWRPFHA